MTPTSQAGRKGQEKPMGFPDEFFFSASQGPIHPLEQSVIKERGIIAAPGSDQRGMGTLSLGARGLSASYIHAELGSSGKKRSEDHRGGNG